MSAIYPMKTKPVFKDYLWGGDKLVTRYGKRTDMRPVAESWEISAYPNSSCVIENGEFAGERLVDLVNANPDLIGGKAAGEFPVLIKLLDAKDKLSLQVHPDDAYARKNGGSFGKNEMWYVVDCEENSELILGFKSPLSREELGASIKDGSILDKVNRVPVKPGDSFQIPAGFLHAIGAGIVIAEVQQSSDLTYRVFDYGRTGADGKPRELHIEKALDVTDTSLNAVNSRNGQKQEFDGFSRTRLTSWEYFAVDLLQVTAYAELSQDNGGFSCLLVLDGESKLEANGESLCLKAGDSVFIPAGLENYTLNGASKALLTSAK